MKFFLIIIITLFLVNCANPYKINFISSRDQMIGGNWKFPFEPAGKDDIVKLYVTDDLSSAEDAFLENGYVKLGSSMFNSSPVDKQSAINFAKTIGASVVVIKSRYTGTITETIPFTVRQPEKKTTIRETKTKPDGKVASREQTITIDGEYQTSYVQQSTDYYDYQAVFWGKMKSPKLGIYVSDLNSEQRQLLQTNRGIYVKVVVKGSPAFMADILKGDIFTEFNDERINERKHFFQLLSKYNGKEIVLKGIRNGSPISIKVNLE